MASKINFVVIATMAAAQHVLAAFGLIFDDVQTLHEKRLSLKRKRELAPYKRNVVPRADTPTTVLQPVHMLHHVLSDYCKVLH